MARVLTCGCVKCKIDGLAAKVEVTLCLDSGGAFDSGGAVYGKQGEALYCQFCGKASESQEKYLRRKHEEEEAKKRMTKLF